MRTIYRSDPPWPHRVLVLGGGFAGVETARHLEKLTAGVAGVLEAGWLGGVTTNLGQSMELSVIAATVIGGANLMGGSGTIFGAVVGAVLIEIIRNSLTLLGISSFWQGTFVGGFIIFAVAFDRIRANRGVEE
jgi:ribose transport system permease protein